MSKTNQPAKGIKNTSQQFKKQETMHISDQDWHLHITREEKFSQHNKTPALYGCSPILWEYIKVKFRNMIDNTFYLFFLKQYRKHCWTCKDWKLRCLLPRSYENHQTKCFISTHKLITSFTIHLLFSAEDKNHPKDKYFLRQVKESPSIPEILNINKRKQLLAFFPKFLIGTFLTPFP